MLILSGLVHAKRRRALIVLLCGFVAMAALQKFESQAAASDRHDRARAWIHAMPHPSFLLAPEPPAFGAYGAAVPAESRGPHPSPAALGLTGEGWYAPPAIEPSRPGR